jgi:hypothetical protein
MPTGATKKVGMTLHKSEYFKWKKPNAVIAVSGGHLLTLLAQQDSAEKKAPLVAVQTYGLQ